MAFTMDPYTMILFPFILWPSYQITVISVSVYYYTDISVYVKGFSDEISDISEFLFVFGNSTVFEHLAAAVLIK